MKHLSHFAKTTPDKVAYRMARSGQTITYAQLDKLSNRNAHALRSLGVGQGDHIALLVENRLEMMGLTWAGQRSGVFYTAISTHLTLSEIAYIIGDCDARVVIVSDTFADMVQHLLETGLQARFFVLGKADDPGRTGTRWRTPCPIRRFQTKRQARTCSIRQEPRDARRALYGASRRSQSTR